MCAIPCFCASEGGKKIADVPMTPEQTIITRSLANQDCRPLFKYVWGGDIDRDLKFPKVADEENKARLSLQRLVLSRITGSWQEILRSIEEARAQVLGNIYVGTDDELRNVLVGATLFGISSIDLIPLAGLCPCRELACRREAGRISGVERLVKKQEPKLPQQPLGVLDGPKFPLAKVDSYKTGYKVEGENTFFNVPVLIETYDEEGVLVTVEAIKNAVLETMGGKSPQIQSLLAQKKQGKPCSEQIADIFNYTVTHMVCVQGKVSKVSLSEPLCFSYFYPRDPKEGKAGVFLVQNLERICRESFGRLKKPLAQAKESEIKNILTLISMRVEQERRQCFPGEVSKVSFTVAFLIGNRLWGASVGDCKTFAVCKRSVKQLDDDTCTTLQTMPRAKVASVDIDPRDSLQAIVQGTKSLTVELVHAAYEASSSVQSLQQRFAALDGIQCKVVEVKRT